MKAIIISISSDIGTALAKAWSEKGWNLYGTYRTASPALLDLEKNYRIQSVPCDLLDRESIQGAAKALIALCPKWDILVLATGNLEPIGKFHETDFRFWEEGVELNLLRQLQFLHQLLPSRNLNSKLHEPVVLFFAGGGVNNAVLNYSSYTLSKIALIKMSEFLDAEIPDTRFVILGPGCVKTKIHEPTLKLALEGQYKKTAERLENENACVPMEKVIQSCTWLVTTPCKAVRGRNFSTASDLWGSENLEKELELDPDMYKLRRHKNSWA